MQSMVLTLGNGQIWLGTFSSSLEICFSFLSLCRLQLPLRKIHSFSFWHWENKRMLSTTCVFQKFQFSSGALSRLTCDLGSLSLLPNRPDSLVTSVPSGVRNCAEPAEHLRSETSFLRTCNIQNLISYIYCIALSKRFTGCVSTWLWNCMRTETNICSMQNVLTGTLLVTDFTNLCKNIDKWNKVEYMRQQLSINLRYCYSSSLEEPHKMSANRNSPTYVAYRYQQSLSHYITCQDTCVQ